MSEFTVSITNLLSEKANSRVHFSIFMTCRTLPTSSMVIRLLSCGVLSHRLVESSLVGVVM
jgi:hypothetical protein